MRIPGTKVYRAFHELDRFSDEQCGRFVRAARRDWWVYRVGRIGVVAAVTLLVGAFGYAVAAKLVMMLLPARSAALTDAGAVVVILAAVVPLTAALLSGFFTRDQVLRRRLRTVINDRGRCLGCGYSLLGAPVDDDLTVRCPECGVPTHVDPALAELQEQGGNRVYRPKALIPTVLSAAERRRRRRAKALLAALVLLVVGGPLLTWGVFEWRLRRDAAVARAEKPGMGAVMALIKTLPEVGDPEAEAWDEFARARALIAQADAKVWSAGQGEKLADGSVIRPEFGILGREVSASQGQSAEERRKAGDLAERMLAEYRGAGLFDAMKKMRTAHIGTAISAGPAQPLDSVLLPHLSHSRQLARINADRATAARRAGDASEFKEALLDIVALARMCEREPFMISRLVAAAQMSLVHDQLTDVLLSRPDAAWLDAVDAVLATPLSNTPTDYHVEGERLGCIDAAAVYYGNPAAVRRRTFIGLTSWAREREERARVGSFTEARDTFNREFAYAKKQAALERYQRDRKLELGSASNLEIVRQRQPATSSFVGSLDLLTVNRRGLQVLAAVERHRVKSGGYPRGLSELVPGELAVLPIDPYSGKGFCFRRIDPAKDRHGRSFLLYVPGRDGVDDGGKESTFYLDAITSSSFPGFDYIINTPHQP